jgi:signal transduction histidine kinase/ActR/RegA family two-component response regulator
MSPDPEIIHAEPHTEIGQIIGRDANVLIEVWSRRAVEEQPTARRVHHEALLNQFREFLQALGRSLIETDETQTNGHCLPATMHGEQRWEVGWSLPEVVRDYQILRLVILNHLEHTLDRPLANREVMAIGLALDEAIAASVFMYTTSRDEDLRQAEETRTDLDRQIQEHLRQRAEALRESDRCKNEFLAILAHELRNPLAPLRNGVEVLNLHGTSDSTVVKIRDIFDRQVQQMSRLLDDLLDVSRIALGKIVLQKQRINLAGLLTHAAQMSEPLLKSRDLHFEVIPPTGDAWLEGDLVRLTQVITNLLNNAAKYTDRGGRIRLEGAREDNKVVIRVRDTGVGISAELLPHIFDLFTQAEWPTDRSQGGLGIGLALVRRLVEMHGGEITVSSSGTGQGSEFIVRLPGLPTASANEESRPSRENDTTGLAPLRRRILAVDDSADAADSLALLLRVQGHDVRVAYEGTTALRIATEFQPDVVLLDIGLPRLDGYEVGRRLREQAGGDHFLLVALTGYGQDEDRQRSAAAGFDAHLVKPVDLATLGQLLSVPLGSRPAFSRAVIRPRDLFV